jgi:hypothetical protein
MIELYVFSSLIEARWTTPVSYVKHSQCLGWRKRGKCSACRVIPARKSRRPGSSSLEVVALGGDPGRPEPGCASVTPQRPAFGRMQRWCYHVGHVCVHAHAIEQLPALCNIARG